LLNIDVRRNAEKGVDGPVKPGHDACLFGWTSSPVAPAAQVKRSFLVLFFKKEPLA
jgi:hypothetical protein